MFVPTGASGVVTRRSASRGASTPSNLSGNDATSSLPATIAAAATKVGTTTAMSRGTPSAA